MCPRGGVWAKRASHTAEAVLPLRDERGRAVQSMRTAAAAGCEITSGKPTRTNSQPMSRARRLREWRCCSTCQCSPGGLHKSNKVENREKYAHNQMGPCERRFQGLLASARHCLRRMTSPRLSSPSHQSQLPSRVRSMGVQSFVRSETKIVTSTNVQNISTKTCLCLSACPLLRAACDGLADVAIAHK